MERVPPERVKIAKEQCDKLKDEARAAQEQGNLPLAAQKYLDAVVASRNLFFPGRMECMRQYELAVRNIEMLTKVVLPESHAEKLKSIAEDITEYKIFRTTAYLLLAIYSVVICDLDQAAKYCRSVFDLAEESREEENRRVQRRTSFSEWNIPITSLDDDGVTHIHKKLGLYINDRKEKAEKLLAMSCGDRVRSNMMYLHSSESLVDRLLPGGTECDCCGKKAEEMAGGELLQCSRCKLAYYCSAQCQKQRWKDGHKQACRSPGQIEAGDIMLVKGIISKRELNGALVKIVQPAGGGRWEVELIEDQGDLLLTVAYANKTISLASKNLAHIRPEK